MLQNQSFTCPASYDGTTGQKHRAKTTKIMVYNDDLLTSLYPKEQELENTHQIVITPIEIMQYLEKSNQHYEVRLNLEESNRATAQKAGRISPRTCL